MTIDLSTTVTVIVSLSSRGPDFTIISKIYPPDYELVGVQENFPESLLIVAPLGWFSRKYSSSLISESVILAVNVNFSVSSVCLFPIDFKFNSKSGKIDAIPLSYSILMTVQFTGCLYSVKNVNMYVPSLSNKASALIGIKVNVPPLEYAFLFNNSLLGPFIDATNKTPHSSLLVPEIVNLSSIEKNSLSIVTDVTSAYTGIIIRKINENTTNSPKFVLTIVVLFSSLLKNTYNLFYGITKNYSQHLEI